MLDDESMFGGVPMGSPQDPADHPVNNIAPKDAMPLQNSGQSFAAEAMEEVKHTGDLHKHLGTKAPKKKK